MLFCIRPSGYTFFYRLHIETWFIQLLIFFPDRGIVQMVRLFSGRTAGQWCLQLLIEELESNFKVFCNFWLPFPKMIIYHICPGEVIEKLYRTHNTALVSCHGIVIIDWSIVKTPCFLSYRTINDQCAVSGRFFSWTSSTFKTGSISDRLRLLKCTMLMHYMIPMTKR